MKLVYACFDGSSKPYLYQTPVALKAGEVIYVETSPNHKRHATVVAPSFVMNRVAATVFLSEIGYTFYKNVLGYCVETSTRTLIPFVKEVM